MPSPSKTRAWLLAVALLGAVGLGVQACSGGDVHVETKFHATGVRSGEEPILRNEPIVIRFTDPLVAGTPPKGTVALTDEGGRAVPFRLEARGRFLSLLPTHDAGWPAPARLKIRLLWPPVGLPLRNVRGEPLQGPFEGMVTIAAGHRRGAGQLTLADRRTLRSLGPRRRASVPATQEQKLVFNAPIDPATLEQGIVIRSLRDKRPLPRDRYYARISPSDGRVVYVGHLMPSAHDEQIRIFRGGGRYELVATRELASYDGRHPLRDRPLAHYQTPEKAFGFIEIDFDEETDFDPSSRHFFHPGEPLRPGRKMRTPVFLQPPGGPQAAADVTLFSDAPATTFIRIPAAFLPEGGERKLFIEAVIFQTVVDPRSRIDIEEFEGSIAYLVAGRDLDPNRTRMERLLRKQVRGLRDLGWIRQKTTRLLRLGLSPDDPGTGGFYYDGEGKDLVLKLSSAGLASAAGDREVRVRAWRPEGDIPDGLFLRIQDDQPVPRPILPCMVLVTYSYQPVITRWYTLPQIKNPVFSRRPNLDFQGKGLELQDFEVEYQGGIVNPDGTIIPVGDWSPYPPRGGPRAVRLRITLTPNPDTTRSGAEELEIDHLILHFQEGKEE